MFSFSGVKSSQKFIWEFPGLTQNFESNNQKEDFLKNNMISASKVKSQKNLWEQSHKVFHYSLFMHKIFIFVYRKLKKLHLKRYKTFPFQDKFFC
jgi:hypothetical protein